MATVLADQARDYAERTVALTKLAEAKNAVIAKGQLQTYLEDLGKVDTPLLLAALVRLRSAVTYGFPDVAVILRMCEDVQREAIPERMRELPPAAALGADDRDPDRRRWVHCTECQDDPGAWIAVWCHGSGDGRDETLHARRDPFIGAKPCGHPRSHVAHSWAERCVCHQAEWRRAARIKRFTEDRRTA